MTTWLNTTICLGQRFSEHIPQNTGSITCSIKKIMRREEFYVQTWVRNAIHPLERPHCTLGYKRCLVCLPLSVYFLCVSNNLNMKKPFWALGPHGKRPLISFLLFADTAIKVSLMMFIRVRVLCAKSCPTLCDHMGCSPSGSPVHGIFRARILEWLPFPSPGDHIMFVNILWPPSSAGDTWENIV